MSNNPPPWDTDPDTLDTLAEFLQGSEDALGDAEDMMRTAIGTLLDAKAIEALRNAILSNDPYLVSAAENAIASINSRNP